MALIGEAIVSAIVDKLAGMALEYLKDQMQWQTGMKSELQRLKDALPRIKAVVEAAESGQLEMTGSLRDWLCQLKDALYDAEDVLDELDYFRLQKLAEVSPAADEGGSSKKKGKGINMRAFLSDSKKKVVKVVQRALEADPTLKALREAVKKIDEVAVGVGNFFNLLSGVAAQQQQERIVTDHNRETGSLLTVTQVFVRDQQRKELMEWLRKMTVDSTDENCISLASLVGQGGMGKTTLAQRVYNDPAIKCHFDLRVWVHISNTFDVQALTKAMLESATREATQVKALSLLQEELKTKLMSSTRPVLVVLDDAWNERNISHWDTLLAPLKSGLPKGSKILLTTRFQAVVDAAEMALRGSTMEASESFHLAGLPEAEFLHLFNSHAFGGLDPDDNLKLKHIGEKIAARLGGLPLAAKVIGRMLNLNMREEYWVAILSKSIFETTEGGLELKSVLKLSYHHLSKDLRPCFVYCSVFPKDYVFEKDELVRVWMAAGLVSESQSEILSETLEETGGRYFDDLLKRSFFEPRVSEYGKSAERYIMHDVLHELAETLVEGECFRIERNMSSTKFPPSVRHLYLATGDIGAINSLQAAGWLKNLRTLHLRMYFLDDTERDKLYEEILHSTRRLRVLFIEGCGASSLRVVVKLKHLRLLSVVSTQEVALPTFCNYNLQSVDFGYDDPDHHGRCLRNLIRLRHCEPRTKGLWAVRKLTSLQELSFVVGSYNKIEALKDLNQLRGLEVGYIEDVASEEEARAAELHRKKHLRRLELRWGLWWGLHLDKREVHKVERVLDGLQPHSNLKELFIYGYCGSRSADWMTPTAFGENLQSITLEICRNWERLPPFGRLPYLKVLKLEEMHAVKQLDCDGGFLQLEALHISLVNLEEFSGLDTWDGLCFPRLCKLEIVECPKLQMLPSLPLTTLVELKLWSVGLIELPELKMPRRDSNTTHCSSLSKIIIYSCQNLRSAKGLLQHCLHPLLEHLDITNCKQLADPQVPPQTFQHLQRVTIKNCRELVHSLPLFREAASTYFTQLYLQLGSIIVRTLPSEKVPGRLPPLEVNCTSDCEDLRSSLEPLKALVGCHLSKLVVEDCPKLVKAAVQSSISGDQEEDDSTFSVDKLVIDDPLLLLKEPLVRNLNSVRELQIGGRRCRVDSITEVEPWLIRNRTSLEILQLHLGHSLQALPSEIQLLSSLRVLELRGAFELKSLLQLPPSLQELWISCAHKTLRERCRKDEGADWPNIKHIPQIKLE